MENYRPALEAEKERLETELARIGRKNPGVPGDFVPSAPEREDESDLLDVARNAQSFAESEGIERDLEARYDSVLAALARIEEGTYGTCTVGGEKIEPARLAADPAAPTCIAHASTK